MSNRCQYVEINNFYSNSLNPTVGIPQGSILGPLFFIMFINDINEIIGPNAKIITYADDTTLSIYCKSLTDLEDNISFYLNKIQLYFTKNGLKINALKTKVMLFNTFHSSLSYGNIDIYFNFVKLEIVNTIMFLGFISDNKLNFNRHI